MSRAGLSLLPLALVACASAQLTAYRDPAYPTVRYQRIAVFALRMSLQSSQDLEHRVCERLTTPHCVPGNAVLPPTRAYSDSEIVADLARAGVDGVLIVSLAADQSAAQYLGTVTSSSTTSQTASSGQVNLYGNSAWWYGNGQSSSSSTAVSTPVYGESRVALAELGLFDRISGNIAWRGEHRVSGQGYLATKNGAFIKAAASKIASSLVADSLVVQ